MASKFPRFQSNRVSVGCAGQTSLIHGGSTSQVHASTGQVNFGSKMGTNTILRRWSYCYARSVYLHNANHLPVVYLEVAVVVSYRHSDTLLDKQNGPPSSELLLLTSRFYQQVCKMIVKGAGCVWDYCHDEKFMIPVRILYSLGWKRF